MATKKKSAAGFRSILTFIVIFAVVYCGFLVYYKMFNEKKVLRQMIERLSADSRVAEVLVTDVQFNPFTQKHMTTIKFLEYDSKGQPMPPRFFTFTGNIIQFQSLVIRFDDVYIKNADALRGKSAYLFWKAFVLDGKNTQEYVITPINEVPQGYKIDEPGNAFEEAIWHEFWNYALDAKAASKKGVKNAQIEAPGTKFIPGMLYTIKIEHDGGLRIDAKEIPGILKGEKL